MYKSSKKTNVNSWPDTLSHPEKIIWERRSFNRVKKEGKYYRATFKHNGKVITVLLHRLVYEKYNDKVISEKCAIHHIDGNPLNNHPANLFEVSYKKHCRDHMKKRLKNDPYWWEKGLQSAREEAKKWHASLKGLKWHSRHGKNTWSDRKKKQKICVVCSKKYYTYYPTKSMYCSKLCKSRGWTKLNANKIKKYNKSRREKRNLIN